jgi:hypothetical protein
MRNRILVWTAVVFGGLLLGVAQSTTAASRAVREVAGNILLVESDGSSKQLTTTGQDSMPSISLDGKKIVFVRSPDGQSRDDVWVVDLNKPVDQQISNITPPELIAKHYIAAILDPQFSPDAATIYFYTEPGNFGLVISVDLASKRSKVLAHGVVPILQGRAFDVIQRGEYAGDLIVYKDSEKLTAGRLFLYWLVSPEGANIAIVADNENDLGLFREQLGRASPK